MLQVGQRMLRITRTTTDNAPSRSSKSQLQAYIDENADNELNVSVKEIISGLALSLSTVHKCYLKNTYLCFYLEFRYLWRVRGFDSAVLICTSCRAVGSSGILERRVSNSFLKVSASTLCTFLNYCVRELNSCSLDCCSGWF